MTRMRELAEHVRHFFTQNSCLYNLVIERRNDTEVEGVGEVLVHFMQLHVILLYPLQDGD